MVLSPSVICAEAPRARASTRRHAATPQKAAQAPPRQLLGGLRWVVLAAGAALAPAALMPAALALALAGGAGFAAAGRHGRSAAKADLRAGSGCR